jgi:hypothetical protein
MPKLQTIAAAHCDTPDQVSELLMPLALTQNQFAVIKTQASQFLPGHIALAQRMPKSVVTITITRGEDEYVLKVNNRARVTLA